jgi:transposase
MHLARFRFVTTQIKEIENERLHRLEQALERRRNAMVLLLARVIGIGFETADMLVK